MDKELTFNEYQSLASRTIPENWWCDHKEHMEQHALHGMVGEMGEIHSIYQKVYQGHEIDISHLRKEIGDLLWFICELCTSHSWSLEAIAELNIDKLKQRYPEGFDPDKSLYRREDDI